jgi:hypothetical protein
MSFLIIAYFYSSTDWRKVHNRYCLEARGKGERGWGQGTGGRNDTNNVHKCE